MNAIKLGSSSRSMSRLDLWVNFPQTPGLFCSASLACPQIPAIAFLGGWSAIYGVEIPCPESWPESLFLEDQRKFTGIDAVTYRRWVVLGHSGSFLPGLATRDLFHVRNDPSSFCSSDNPYLESVPQADLTPAMLAIEFRLGQCGGTTWHSST